MRKLLAIATAGVIAALTLAAPAAAGGWAVTSLDPMVAAPVAGEDIAVGFTIRQHGVTPVALDDVAIVVTDPTGGTTRFTAVPDGVVGHYVATIRLPAAGRYRWSVEQGWFGPQDLGTLDVTRTSTATLGSGSDSSPLTTPLAGIAAALLAVGLYDLARSSARRRAAA